MSDSHDTSFELDDDLSRFQQPDDRAQPAPYLDALNSEQSEAVTSLDGPTLVLAGAGTGKTRVLTTRLAHILATRRAYPGQILAVTFTNKAAREMKERIGQLIGSVVEGMQWLGTFHSIGAKILRQHAELVDLNRDFTILDTDDQIRLIKQILSAENIDEKRWPARQLAAMIDSWKNKGANAQTCGAIFGRRLCQWPIYRPLCAISATPSHAQRGRLWRPHLREPQPAQRQSGCSCPISSPISLHHGRRISRHKCGTVFVVAPACPGTQKHLLRWGTMTNRSTAGAAPRSITF